jgi:outer membrane protein assembly factor BamA
MYTHRNPLANASWLILTAICLHSAAAQKAVRLVEAIEIQGNRRLADQDMLDYVSTRPGEAFSLKRVERDLKAILASGFFDARQTRFSLEEGREDGIVVVFEVVELPLIAEVKFAGLRQVREADLRAVLRDRRIDVVQGAVFKPRQGVQGSARN